MLRNRAPVRLARADGRRADASLVPRTRSPSSPASGASWTRWPTWASRWAIPTVRRSTRQRTERTGRTWSKSSSASLDPRCLLDIRINPESRVSVDRGGATPQLVEQGWRAYLVKVRNEAGVTGALRVESPQARPVYRRSTGASLAPRSVLPADIVDRWLALDTYEERPMEPELSGLDLEYRIVLLYSRDHGRREAQIGAMLEAATQDIGYRNRTAVLFDIAPSRDVTFGVRDENGNPCMASFIIEDSLGRVYPARSKRLAPDFFFHDQVYRADGETVRLPAGEFTVTCGRGPEYLPETRIVTIDSSGRSPDLDFSLRRWIDPPGEGWVFRRPSHPRRRLQPLREPYGRRGPRGHDASRPRRGAERGSGAQLGTRLLSPASVLRSCGARAFDRVDAHSVRPGGLRVPVELLRTSRAAPPSGPGLPRDASDRGLAPVGSADPQVGESAGSGHRVRSLRAWAAGDLHRAAELRDARLQWDRRKRVHHGTSRTMSWISSPPRIRPSRPS